MNHLMKDHLLSTHTVPHISHTHLSYAAYFAFLQKILKENPHTHTSVSNFAAVCRLIDFVGD